MQQVQKKNRALHAQQHNETLGGSKKLIDFATFNWNQLKNIVRPR